MHTEKNRIQLYTNFMTFWKNKNNRVKKDQWLPGASNGKNTDHIEHEGTVKIFP